MITAKFDPNYEKQRNALIPEAERYANKLLGPEPLCSPIKQDVGIWRMKWTRAFLAKMDELAQAAGLTAPILST